ncbi:hypothetical protein MK805_05635 [Shimazuella sp. AN120528]|uniref:hypothetical protein n=1 Tax=Shimazuella soli TaxID=1892854 RepID=UPI001F0F1AE0|nr:hypothetical protein [Shimazuella soli]MCH5584448.1 hypothetical protein [Shimazuella soli]
MNILVARKFGWLIGSLLLVIVLAGCGNSGVSTDVLEPLWTKQVNQEVTPWMKDVFAPVSSKVSSELIFYSDTNWDVPEDKLPNYKYGLQHAKETVNGDLDPLLVVHVKLNEPFEAYEINQLKEQIWSAIQQLKINGIKSGKIKLEYGQQTYFSGPIQSINEPGDMEQYFTINSKG